MDRTVLVTGASGGVGRAVAREFAARGDDVALLARGAAGLQAAAAEVRATGRRALELPADVADFAAVDAAADRVERELGPIDIWVNCAFTGVFAPFTDIPPDEFRRVTEVTYLGYVHGTRAALDRMLPRDRGTVVQVGSALAYRGIPLQSAYCGAKHAIQGWNEALRCELLHRHSRVHTTMVQLPGMDTPQFDWVRSRLPRRPRPVPPVYRPEAAARAVARAADRPRRREYRVGTSTVATLLGNAVAPALLDRYLARTGYGAQQSDRPEPEDAPDNLWHPADRDTDAGAHGRFASESRGARLQQAASHHHGRTALAACAAAGAGYAAARAAAAALRSRR